MGCERARQVLGSEDKQLLNCFISTSSVTEQGTTFSIDNPTDKELCCLQVDGCLINDDDSKCDYLFIHQPPTTYSFVELKSKSDVSHAFDQVKRSVEILSKKLKMEKSEIHAFVVTKLTPVGANQHTRTFRAVFQRDLGRDIIFFGDGKKEITI